MTNSVGSRSSSPFIADSDRGDYFYNCHRRSQSDGSLSSSPHSFSEERVPSSLELPQNSQGFHSISSVEDPIVNRQDPIPFFEGSSHTSEQIYSTRLLSSSSSSSALRSLGFGGISTDHSESSSSGDASVSGDNSSVESDDESNSSMITLVSTRSGATTEALTIDSVV